EITGCRSGLHLPLRVVDLLHEAAACIQAIDGHLRSKDRVRQERRAEPHGSPPRRRLRVDDRRALAAQRVETLAEEAAPRSRPFQRKAPAQITRQGGIVRYVDIGWLYVLANRPHARREGILRNRLVDIDRLFAAGEARQSIMATRPMIDRA